MAFASQRSMERAAPEGAVVSVPTDNRYCATRAVVLATRRSRFCPDAVASRTGHARKSCACVR